MTESEWQASKALNPMLGLLGKRNSPWKWSTRKARLFACACCRRQWDLLTDPGQQQAVDAAERCADKLITVKDLTAFYEVTPSILLGIDATLVSTSSGSRSQGSWNFWVQFNANKELSCNPGANAARPTAWGEPRYAANDMRALLHFRVDSIAAVAEHTPQCDLLRDIVGPTLVLPAIDRAWRTAASGAVRALASSIYEERRFEDLPILADALEDAGCTDVVILDHCRGRGCWVVDGILGKK